MRGEIHWPDFLERFAVLAESRGFSVQQLAETQSGPLMIWERSAPLGPRVYLSAGIHGDEPAGPLALSQLMAEDFFAEGVHWLIAPCLNPEGLALGTRENASGLDLNRDYWKRTSSEITAHAAWLEAMPVPWLFLSLHEDWEAQGFYFYEINLGVDEPCRARDILEAVRPWFEPDSGHEIDGHLPRDPGWIFHAAEADVPEGWPEAIFLAKQDCPLSFTFETPSHAKLEARVAAHCAAVRAAIQGVVGKPWSECGL